MTIKIEDIIREYEGELQIKLWEIIGETVRRITKLFTEHALEAEVENQVGVKRYMRSHRRRNYRNGYYKRMLLTTYGKISNLRVPRVRYGGMEFKSIEKYKRRTKEVDAAIGRLFIEGVSTRRLRKIAEEIYGEEISHSTISKTYAALEEEYNEFLKRPIMDEVQFLFLDGVVVKVGGGLHVRKKVLLCALGTYKDGRSEIISFRLVDVENRDNWEAFLSDIKARGLMGKNLKLIITDGHKGLEKAISRIYPFIPHQKCIAHKLRNVCVKISKRNRDKCIEGVREVFNAKSKKEAMRKFKQWKKEWIVEEERAVRSMEYDLEKYFTYYEFKKDLWRKIRTVNVLERTFRELRRRLRPMNILPSEKSSTKIVYGIAEKLNSNWREKKCNFTQNT